ncbi:hypothetical protein CRENBAI_019928 [Crenichthys baileyi]|uniref:Ig-like domain-containing protein n=1 Tax=Crenichthys baileyi TaxID=28760 RepID=A0AAV9QZU3_9TELE
MERRISTLVLLCVVWSAVAALQVNIPNDQYEFARGDDITLPCTFTSAQSSPKTIIISWSAEGPDTGDDDPLILTYYHPDGSTDITTKYENRVSVDVNIIGPSGKADLKLSSVTAEDNKRFECRVQIPKDDEGKLADTARLTVLVAPSTPICEIKGTAEYGQNINLTCYSKEGSPTPTYKWDSRDVSNMPRVADPRTTDKGGILSLYNISKDTSGYYTCTSSNKIRSASCNITLSVMPPSLKMSSTAIIAVAIAIAILILFIIIIYCCCCRKKNKDKEEYAMGVHDKELLRKDENGPTDVEGSTQGHDDSSVSKPANRRDNYEERSERNYDDRRSDYDDRRSDYDDRRSDYDDRRSDYDDRRSDYDDRRSDYVDRRKDYDRRNDRDDRRSDYNDRHNDHDDRRSKNSDRHERYDDDCRYDNERRNNNRRDPRYDDDRSNHPKRP